MSERIDKAFGQFLIRATALFAPFDKYGYTEMRDGAIAELKFLTRRLKRSINGENVIIATKKEIRQMTGEESDD